MLPAPALAATPAEHEAITLLPAVLFVEGDPGERVTTKVLLQNQTRTDVRLKSELADMQEGIGNSTAFDYLPVGEGRRGAGAWIEPRTPARFDLERARERSVAVTIDIPADAGAGGWYAAIVFTAEDPRPSASIPIDQTIPVPILVTVTGKFRRDLRASVEPASRWRWSGGTATWTVDLRNEGDVHEVYGGRLTVDGPLSAPRSRDLRPGILLPGEHRRIRQTFELRDAPDLVAARLRIERDEGSAVEDAAPRVVVLPWWLLVVLALAAAIIAWRLRSRARDDGAWEADGDEGSWDPSSPAG